MAQLMRQEAPTLATCRCQPAAPTLRSGFFHGTALPALRRAAAPPIRTASLSIEARYRGRGTDLSKVSLFQRHGGDVGSTEVQIARRSTRVLQLTSHLKQHRKDYAATRGLVILLGQRRRLMTYLYQQDRPKYESLLRELNVRPLKVQAARGVIVKLTEGDEVEVMASQDMAAATGVGV